MSKLQGGHVPQCPIAGDANVHKRFLGELLLANHEFVPRGVGDKRVRNVSKSGNSEECRACMTERCSQIQNSCVSAIISAYPRFTLGSRASHAYVGPWAYTGVMNYVSVMITCSFDAFERNFDKITTTDNP